MRGFRTDLAMESVGEESGRLEGVSMSAHQIGGVKRTRIVIQSRRAAEVLQRPVGEYITLECPELSRCGQPERPLLIRLIAQAVRALLPREGGSSRAMASSSSFMPTPFLAEPSSTGKSFPSPVPRRSHCSG